MYMQQRGVNQMAYHLKIIFFKLSPASLAWSKILNNFFGHLKTRIKIKIAPVSSVYVYVCMR